MNDPNLTDPRFRTFMPKPLLANRHILRQLEEIIFTCFDKPSFFATISQNYSDLFF